MHFGNILLILALFCFSRENDEYCLDENECYFNVTYNNPISPKIPTFRPHDAILGDYRYIYLEFDIPMNQKQKTFYLEAYETTSGDTIISNGNCYLIDTNKNSKYEIRIYKALKKDSYVQFGFLGIPEDFVMSTHIVFPLSLYLYWTDIALGEDNSLYKEEIEALQKYIEQRKWLMLEKIERQNSARQTIIGIADRIFGTIIDVEPFENDFTQTVTISYFPLIITLKGEVGLQLSNQGTLVPESIVISETKVINGKLYYHYNGIDILKDEKININNNVLNMIELYNNQILSKVIDFGIETNTYSVTVSINDNFNIISIIIRYYLESNNKILYEVKLQFTIVNIRLKQKFKSCASHFVKEAIPEIIPKIDLIIEGMIIVVSTLSLAISGFASVEGGSVNYVSPFMMPLAETGQKALDKGNEIINEILREKTSSILNYALG